MFDLRSTRYGVLALCGALLYICCAEVKLQSNKSAMPIVDVMVTIDSSSPDDRYMPCEPTIVIDHSNPRNIVAASVLDQVYFSSDGGYSWTERKLRSPYGVAGDPVLVSTHDGDILISHLSNPSGSGRSNPDWLDRIVVQKSQDGGVSWSEGSYAGYRHPKDQDKQWMAAHPEENFLAMTWTEFDVYGDSSADCHSRILYSSSADGGNTWTEEISLSAMEGNCADGDQTTEGAVPAVNSEGHVFVSWSYDENIVFNRSTDRGMSWMDKEMVIAQQVGGWEYDIPGHNRTNGMPITCVDNSSSKYSGNIYVHWSDQRGGENNTDLWIVSSDDGGDSWSEPMKVVPDRKGTHQYLSWMCVDDYTGRVYIVYYHREDDSTKTYVRLAWSEDGGRSFQSMPITTEAFEPSEEFFFGDYTNIDALNGMIMPIWTEMNEDKTTIKTAIISHNE